MSPVDAEAQMAKRFLRANEVAWRLGFHRSTLYRKIASGTLPPPVRLSELHGQPGGAVAWPEVEIDRYAKRLIAEREAHYRNIAPARTSRSAKRDRMPAKATTIGE